MKKIILGGFVVLIVIAATFFTVFTIKQFKRQQAAQAIVNVWNQYPAAVRTSTITNRKLVKLDLMRLTNILAKVDCSHCPTDFQAAWLRMVKAETEVAVHDNLGTSFIAVLSALKGNGARLSDVNERIAEFNASLIQCQQVISQYGLKFSSPA